MIFTNLDPRVALKRLDPRITKWSGEQGTGRAGLVVAFASLARWELEFQIPDSESADVYGALLLEVLANAWQRKLPEE
jgi:hypothetical protein